MKISSVSTLNVAGIADGRRNFTRSNDPSNLVVLAGPPGSGKTSLLEAICETKESIAPYGGSPGRTKVAVGQGAAKVSVEWWLDDEELQLVGGERHRPSEALFGDVKPAHETSWDDGLRMVLGRWAPHHPKVEYFHAPRRMASPAAGVSGTFAARSRLTREDTKYDGIHDQLVMWTLEGDERALGFEKAFAALCPTRGYAGILRRGNGRYLGFERQGVEAWSPIHELSSAEHQAALFAAAFVVLGLWRSVVLIDNPELFMPSDAVVPFVRTLAALGDNQLIVATGSKELATSGDGVVIDMGRGAES